MEYKLTVWQNVDLLEDGDFTVTAIEYEPDEDGSFDSCTLYGFWTPLNGNEVPATMDIDLDEPVLEPEDALERGWAIVMIAPDALTLQVVRRELSPTAGQLAEEYLTARPKNMLMLYNW